MANPQDKYLKQRGSVWYFQRAVPKLLQAAFGKVIVETLGTSDLRKARVLRDAKKVTWDILFREKQPEDSHLSSPEKHTRRIMSDLKHVLGEVIEQDVIPEDEEEGIRIFLSNTADTLIKTSDQASLSTRREVSLLYKALAERMDKPIEFNPNDARLLLNPDQATVAKNKTMPELRDDFLTCKANEDLPEKTIAAHKRHLSLLEEHSWDVVELKKELEQSGKAAKTIENYLTNIRVFSKWLVERGVNLTIPKFKKNKFAKTRDVFTVDELNTLNNSSMDETDRWIVLVSLYQGMRQGEVLQLKFNDIRELHDYWCFQIHDRGAKQLKNTSSVRSVPIHPWLIKNGFLDYWKENKGWAKAWKSYDGTASQGFSKHINPIIRDALGLETASTETGKKVFHSLRHTFRDHCREAEVHPEIVNTLGGWSTAGFGEGAAYGQGYSIKRLYEELTKVKFI